MPVYVDQLRDFGWRYGRSCHLIADTLAELFAFATEKLVVALNREINR